MIDSNGAQKEIIREPPEQSYLSLPKTERRIALFKNPIAIVIGQDILGTAGSKESILSRLDLREEFADEGMSIVDINEIYAGLSICMGKNGFADVPHSNFPTQQSLESGDVSKNEKKAIIDAQRTALSQARDSFTISTQEGQVRFFYHNEQDKNEDISREINLLLRDSPELIQKLKLHQSVQKATIDVVQAFTNDTDQSGVIILIDSVSQAPKNTNIFFIGNTSNTSISWKKPPDRVIDPKPEERVANKILRESLRIAQLSERRRELFNRFSEINLRPEFTADNWPSHPLLSNLKDQIQKRVNNFIEDSGEVCDPQDLRYQIAFRMTTFPLSEAYQNGDELKKLLTEFGAYKSWENIPMLPQEKISNFELNPELLKSVLDEQYAIIKERLQKSTLPVGRILTPEGIFAEADWEIKKEQGQIFAQNRSTGVKKLIRFGPVDKELAMEYHEAFHYIHTPRCDFAYGLWIDGEELPFSVISLQTVDRKYKKNMLLLHGFDPHNTLDITRLYSRPGTPQNTSSTIFASVISDLKSTHPEIQALLSAFMPSWATGKSMLSGGFDHPVLIKPNRHTFGKRVLDNGKIVYEHLTRRRSKDIPASNILDIHPDFPMLPVIELMSPLQPPRYPPHPELKNNMVVVTS